MERSHLSAWLVTCGRRRKEAERPEAEYAVRTKSLTTGWNELFAASPFRLGCRSAWPYPNLFEALAFPWLAQLFVPLDFPLEEGELIEELKAKNGLKGSAGELVAEPKTSKNGTDGIFYQFRLDGAMRDSILEIGCYLSYEVHQMPMLVTPNRNNPDGRAYKGANPSIASPQAGASTSASSSCLLYTSPSPRDRG